MFRSERNFALYYTNTRPLTVMDSVLVGGGTVTRGAEQGKGEGEGEGEGRDEGRSAGTGETCEIKG